MPDKLRNRMQHADSTPEVCPAAIQNSSCLNITESLIAIARENMCSKVGLFYTDECICTICENLFQIAIVLPRNPQSIFMKRLRLYCASLEFLDPPCNMIADQYDKQIYELSAANSNETTTFLQQCQTLTLCR
ncbi:unnamed protein product [Gongylonema pulchrum]|uniref:Saposin B-type domain-containing protein n=1 Tax=Gongylonema pulchrum TaxID=637853 RepID=A0A3P7LLP2_9BILA|nr:unnamed protein product [Gongylonema pulchrum]